jgi:hypothetical protein
VRVRSGHYRRRGIFAAAGCSSGGSVRRIFRCDRGQQVTHSSDARFDHRGRSATYDGDASILVWANFCTRLSLQTPQRLPTPTDERPPVSCIYPHFCGGSRQGAFSDFGGSVTCIGDCRDNLIPPSSGGSSRRPPNNDESTVAIKVKLAARGLLEHTMVNEGGDINDLWLSTLPHSLSLRRAHTHLENLDSGAAFADKRSERSDRNAEVHPLQRQRRDELVHYGESLGKRSSGRGYDRHARLLPRSEAVCRRGRNRCWRTLPSTAAARCAACSVGVKEHLRCASAGK